MTTELPAEVVEVAARALWLTGSSAKPSPWDEVSDGLKGRYRMFATAALSAAAPFIRAQALEYAAQDFPADLPEFADMGADGLIDYISVEDWLNTRAKQERGEG